MIFTYLFLKLRTHFLLDSGIGTGKETPKSGLSQKKRQTLFVQPSDNFFGIADIKAHKYLARKKSTSNFLCNYGIIEKSEHSSNSDNYTNKQSNLDDE